MVEYIPHGAKDALKLSVGMVKSMLAVPTKSGVYPTDNDCVKFIALCQARKLNPFEGDAFLIGYDTKDGAKFNLITAHQAFLKRAETSPEFDGMSSGVIVERNKKLVDLEGDFHLDEDKVVGGWAIVHYKTRRVPMQKRLRLKRFQKPFGIWQEDPAGMIVKCTEADALRSAFPTMCGGMYLKEEYREDAQDKTMATPIFKMAPPGEPVNQLASANPEPEAISPRDRISVLCVEHGVTEDDLMGHLQHIEVIPPDIDAINDLDDDSVSYVLNEWDNLAAKIKEVKDK